MDKDYPKWLYHATEPARVFDNKEDAAQAMHEGWVESPAELVDEDGAADTDDRETLITEAESLGIEVGPRWGVKRLQKAIDDKRAETH